MRRGRLRLTSCCSFTKLCLTLPPQDLELVMPSNQLILCCPLLLLPSIFNGHEFEQALGDGEGQGSLACLQSMGPQRVRHD